MREMFLNKEEFERKREKEYQYVREVLDFGWHNTRSAGFVTRIEEKFYGKGCPNRCPLYKGTPQKYERGLCPVCERVQPNLFSFKTHYKVRNDKTLAIRQMDALDNTGKY